MKHILVIEDDNDINNLICETLHRENMNCTAAYSGTEGLLYIKQNQYDLVLLDLMLPGKTGEEVLKEIRKISDTAVIVVSAKDELDNKVDLLVNGADDYMTKPFQIKELAARVQVQLRRKDKSGSSSLIIYKDMKLDKNNHNVMVNEQEIRLTRQEFSILELLISNPKKVYSKQEIYEYAWDDYYIGEDKTLNVHISNIRNKVKQVTNEDYIETVWGIGFKAAGV